MTKVISVEHLTKEYELGVINTGTLTRDINKWWARLRGKPDPYAKIGEAEQSNVKGEKILALDDVSFTVERGEVLGIIGPNGAGKSTLLKILSQVTAPTSGVVKIKGRIGSLLEVGTGFHPELTGRENIYLNGAILGMTRQEVDSKFDEIVDFSGVEKFIDTPVKRYSSGMYVRLAFAVAAHLDPEILIVDEVLAVGDAEFQKKALGKMGDVSSKEGRTVLFVSHNMIAIDQLCTRGIVLKNGRIFFKGSSRDAINKYTQKAKQTTEIKLKERNDRKGSQWLKFNEVTFHDETGNKIRTLMSGQNVSIRIHYKSKKQRQGVKTLIAFSIKNEKGYLLSNLNSIDTGNTIQNIYKEGYFECHWDNFNLRSGNYFCTLFCSIEDEIVDWISNAFTIQVDDGNFYETGKLIDRNQGDILIKHYWTSKKE